MVRARAPSPLIFSAAKAAIVLDPQPAPTAGTPAPLPHERRREPRRQCPSEPLLRYVVRPSLEARWGHALDVSARGIGFLAAEPLRPGAVLALQLRGGTPGASLVRVARVARCTPAGAGRWHVGCSVSPPFSGEEIASLL
jgi:hypothetical protein